MGPDTRAIGLLAASEDPVAVDVVLAWVMGFDWQRIPVLANAIGELAGGLRLTGFDGDPSHLPVHWIDESGERTLPFSEIETNLAFVPHSGWKGSIERTASSPSASPAKRGEAQRA